MTASDFDYIRGAERRIQALGAAISRRNWAAVEVAHAAIRDEHDRRVGRFHKMDNEAAVFFYEQEFYVLSNFSAFEVEWSGFTFKTSEHLYHWMRYTLSDRPDGNRIAGLVKDAPSAHEAFRIAQSHKQYQFENWDGMKLGFMKRILIAKATQHEYVKRKLLETGDRELIEDSWRDPFWGWGPNRDGQNWLGKLWMVIRKEFKEGQ